MNKLMQIVIIVLFLITAIKAQDQTITEAWAFNLTYFSPQLYPPSLSSSSTCQSSSKLASYAALNYTFSSSSIREIIALPADKASTNIALYKGAFNPSSPCSNFVRFLSNSVNFDISVSLLVLDYYYFEQNIPYFFVIVSSDVTSVDDSLEMVINIIEPTVTATFTPAHNFSVVYEDDEEVIFKCAINTSNSGSYWKYTWQQSTSGFFDIIGASGVSANFDFGLYGGNLSDIELEGNPCSSSINVFSSIPGNNVAFQSVYLQEGNNYTAVISRTYYNTDIAVSVVPSGFERLIKGWVLPDYTTGSCIPSRTYVDMDAIGRTFQASYPRTLIVSDSGYFYYAFAYRGNNAGTNTTLPVTCPGTPLLKRSTSGALVIPTTPNDEYVINYAYYINGTTTPQIAILVIAGGYPTEVQRTNRSTTTTTSTTGSSTGSNTSGSSTSSSASSRSASSYSSYFTIILMVLLNVVLV